MNVDGMSPCLMLAFVSLLLSTTAAWNAFPSFAVRTVPNTMAGRSLDSSAARSSSTLSTPPTLSPLTVDEEEQASPYQVAPLWPSHSNGYAHKSNDTVAVIQTSSLSTIPTPETLVSVVGDSALAMESDEQSMEQLTLELQAQAATDASSFEATKFHPWITNCHVQTIGGFVLRDTPAAFLPKHNPLGSVRRIWQGIQSKVQKPADDNGPACSRSDFWDVRQTIPTKDGDWFHADTKYAIGTASAGGQKKMKQTPFFLSETLPTINHKNDNHDDHHPLIDVSTMELLSSSSSTDRRPTHVVLIHGLESNSNSSLSKQIAQACHEQDMTVTCLNFRSCSMDGQGKTLPNELLGGYHLGFTDDLKYYLELNKNKNEDIYLVGFSLGANVVLKALGELGIKAVQDYGIRGAAVACAPFEQETNAKALARPGVNRFIYTNGLLKSLKRKAVDQWKQFCSSEADPGSPSAKAVREYEKKFQDRCSDAMEDFSKALQRTWVDMDDIIKGPREGVVQGVSELVDSVGKFLDGLGKVEPETSQRKPCTESAPAPSITPAWALKDVSSVTNVPKLRLEEMKQIWKSFTNGFSKIQTGVSRETILASAIMGSLVATNAGSMDHLDVAVATGLLAAYSSLLKGPVGAAMRVMGNLGLSVSLLGQELLRQSQVVRQERAAELAALPTAHTDMSDKLVPTKGKDLFDLPRALAAKTITEFDDAFIAPIYGFDDCWDYYRKTSSVFFLEDIVVPTLVVNAQDDPFFDPSVHPVEKTVDGGGRAPVKLVRTDSGGHLGFCFQQVEGNQVDGEAATSNGVSWMPSELARFLGHIQGRRRSKRALLQHLLPVEQLYGEPR